MAEPTLAETARRLIRRTRSGVLATTAGPEGAARGISPGAAFASLVTQAPAPDLAPLLWLSALALHTRNLARDPRCSLFLGGPPATPNPQTAPRVTLIGTATPATDPALLARWHALNPYAAAYANLADFSLWRFSINAAHVVGGFAAAATLDPALLTPPVTAAAALAAAEPALLARCNEEHADVMDAIAAGDGGTGSGWRIVAIDPDGCDLARGEIVLRIDFPAPATSAKDVEAELVRLARAARERPGSSEAAEATPHRS